MASISRLDAVVGAFLLCLSISNESHTPGGDFVERVFTSDDKHEGGSLRHYTLAKQEVAALVRAEKQLFQAQGAREAAERCQELLVQLAEDRFNLVVVGQFKRGKSTLMNALLGRDLLPTGLLPLTSAITTLRYGSTERVMLRREGWGREQEVPLAQLADYTTERGNPGNEKGLIEARVELPLPFLRRGLHFIDTPGIGSARHENTATTYAFLPQMSAVIFVTSVEAPLSEAEEDFLNDIRGQVRQLFVVVNKIDMLGDTEREEVLGYIYARMKRLLGAGFTHLYPLSARHGLEARLNSDDVGIQQSGLASFEQALTAFLAQEQGRAFLLSILDRALHLFAEPVSVSAPASTDSEIEPSGDALELRRAMESLQASLLADASLSTTLRVIEPAASEPRVIDQAIAAGRSPASRTGGEQANARTRTCPICAAQSQSLFAFFAQWQYTLATDARSQRAFAAEGGFCPVHTWQYQEMASPQGISDGYAPLIEMMAAELPDLVKRGAGRAAAHLAARLADTTRCAACHLVRETAAEQATQLLTRLISEAGRADYASSAGLCLPHLQVTLAHVEKSIAGADERNMVVELLLSEQVRRLEDLADDLRSYTLKRDALRRGLLNQEEANAWRRALVLLVGERAARGGATMADQGTV